jgi:hypothetical protein
MKLKNINWLKGNLEIHEWIPDFSLKDTRCVYVLWYKPHSHARDGYNQMSMEVNIVIAEFTSFKKAQKVKRYLEALCK